MLEISSSIAKKRSASRARIILISFLLFASFLLYNVLYLSLFRYKYYVDKVYDQITTSSVLRAERGAIYDSNMNPLAITQTRWRVFISTKEIKKAERKDNKKYGEIIAKGLSDILKLDYNSLLHKIKTSNVLDVTVKKSVDEDEYKKIISFINNNSLESLVFTEAQTSRTYPMNTMAAHVIGFTGSDNQGLYGLEYSYNKMLSGTNGYYLYAKDAGGNTMPGGYADYIPAKQGYSLVTTIDTYLQQLLEDQLEVIRTNHQVTNRVTGIVMDTNTGAILAMATSSPFNPNSPYTLDELSESVLASSGYTEGSPEYKAKKTELLQTMWSNKAVSEMYEPGSTFKIVTVSAALDSKKASVNDKFTCNGYHNVGGWRIKCHKTTGHGSGFDLAYGLQMSCNPTMMTIAERMGADTLYSYVERFGYFEKTGIDLPGEAGYIFHDINNIGPTELATISFGQRFKVSVISQLRAISAVANGGFLVEPYLVDKIIDTEGNVISKHKTIEERRVISEDTAKTVSDILEKGVSGDGGAKNAYVEGYYIAAKTGTSQKFEILDANGNSFLRIGSTVAFANCGEKSISMILVVDEPQSTVKYGSVVAAPYISEFMSKALPYLEYESKSESKTYITENYIGMHVNSAKEKLTTNGLKYKVIGSGSVVLSQIPSADVEIISNFSTVYLYTTSEATRLTTIPSLCGLTAYEANILAANSGLNLKIIGINDFEKRKNLIVADQSISPGTKVEKGTVIVIRILQTDFED